MYASWCCVAQLTLVFLKVLATTPEEQRRKAASTIMGQKDARRPGVLTTTARETPQAHMHCDLKTCTCTEGTAARPRAADVVAHTHRVETPSSPSSSTFSARDTTRGAGSAVLEPPSPSSVQFPAARRRDGLAAGGEWETAAAQAREAITQGLFSWCRKRLHRGRVGGLAAPHHLRAATPARCCLPSLLL